MTDTDAATASAVAAAHPQLIQLSRDLYDHPETAWEEVRSARRVAGQLSDNGFDVTERYCDLDTAFAARIGSGDLHIALCAEYDALPGLGHACGHNLISAITVGAALALAPVVDDLGLTLTVLGTPAEEGGGGKIELLERGGFGGQHASAMVHPGPVDVARARPFAVSHSHIEYKGKSAHAAAFPERGVNAADAFTIAQVAIGLLRQHLRPFDQVHGIVTHGGDATNVVPAHTEGTWMARSRTLSELEQLTPRVSHCFEAGALATGSTLTLSDVCPPYAHMEHDHDFGELYRANAGAIGRPKSTDGAATFSTDMGNVSLAMPSIHPCIAIDTGGAVNHQPEFTAAAVNASADRAVAEGALAMAWTVIDAATGPLRDRLLRAER